MSARVPIPLAELRELRREWRSGRDLAPSEVGEVLRAAIHYASIVEAARKKAQARLLKHRQAKAKLARKEN